MGSQEGTDEVGAGAGPARPTAPGVPDDAHAQPTAVGLPGAGLRRGDVVGRYVVLAQIGRGGMGAVYAAYDPELDRKVAIKLLLAGPEDPARAADLRTRRVREAQALAQLAHPSVVTVHDVGTLGDRVWVAMEFVDGVTLSGWLRQQPRGWQEVVRTLRRAGEGLAAAHAAGLVHRDVKPDNVMVSADGRVRVMDFGLARAAGPAAAPPDLRASSSALAAEVTRAGAVMGTPQYMAPEQWLGAATDARTDQFSFCVTLWEALYGQRPFAGGATELAMRVTEGRRDEPPARAGVPSWLRAAVERGLATAPAARWPSMEALLAALAGGARRRRRRLAVAAAAAALVGLGAGLGSARWAEARAARACDASGMQIREAWSPATRAELQAALAATGLAYAPATFDRLAPILDRYADDWQVARAQACRARVAGRWDAATGERAEACLLEARWALEGLLAVLREGGEGVVQPAVDAAGRLPPTAACLDATWLAHRPALPHAAATRAEAAAVRRGLEQARARAAAGDYREAAALAGTLVTRADATGWRPLAAQARVLAGELTDRAGEPLAAVRLLEDGLFLAEELGEDGLVADAASLLTDVVGDNLARFEEGLRWGRLADGLVRRLGEQEGTRGARLAAALAGVHEARGDFARAEPFAARALAIWERILGPGNPSVAVASNNLAIVRHSLGRRAEAKALFERALALTEATSGPEHPTVAAMLNNLGNVYQVDEDLDEALRLFERALALRERTLGPEHPNVALGLVNLAAVHIDRGEYAAAEGLARRALALSERRLGPDHPDLASSLDYLAMIATARGELDAALATARRAVAIHEARADPDALELAMSLLHLGEVLRARGALTAAEQAFTRVTALFDQQLGPDHPELVGPLRQLGEVALARGESARATATLERAVRLGEAGAASREVALARFALARALGPDDPTRARALAARAATEIRGEDPRARRLRGEIAAWLARAPPPG
jgi:tetratricopeptide (TPR) repeat protein